MKVFTEFPRCKCMLLPSPIGQHSTDINQRRYPGNCGFTGIAGGKTSVSPLLRDIWNLPSTTGHNVFCGVKHYEHHEKTGTDSTCSGKNSDECLSGGRLLIVNANLRILLLHTPAVLYSVMMMIKPMFLLQEIENSKILRESFGRSDLLIRQGTPVVLLYQDLSVSEPCPSGPEFLMLP